MEDFPMTRKEESIQSTKL